MSISVPSTWRIPSPGLVQFPPLSNPESKRPRRVSALDECHAVFAACPRALDGVVPEPHAPEVATHENFRSHWEPESPCVLRRYQSPIHRADAMNWSPSQLGGKDPLLTMTFYFYPCLRFCVCLPEAARRRMAFLFQSTAIPEVGHWSLLHNSQINSMWP